MQRYTVYFIWKLLCMFRVVLPPIIRSANNCIYSIWYLSHRILIYIQQDATLHSLFYLETALHVSGGTSTHHQERKQLYLQHLVFVTPYSNIYPTRCNVTQIILSGNCSTCFAWYHISHEVRLAFILLSFVILVCRYNLAFFIFFRFICG